MATETKIERVCAFCRKLKLDVFYYRRDQPCCSKCNAELDEAELVANGYKVV